MVTIVYHKNPARSGSRVTVAGAPGPDSPRELKVEFCGCPVQASLGVLGRKWTFLVLRNIALYRKQRFREMLRTTPGLTNRVLTMRLRELEREGLIEVVERGRHYVKWGLTAKGEDAIPVLLALARFGSKWYATEVFEDGVARSLPDIFTERYLRKVVRNLTAPLPRRFSPAGGRGSTPVVAPAPRAPPPPFATA